MNIRDTVRPIPGVRQLSLFRQKIRFAGSAHHWESNYSGGGTSGHGSYGELALGKAAFLNTFVQLNAVMSVIEFGCGDGNQLSHGQYPRYVGLDISPAAISMCRQRFAQDCRKSFFRYDPDCYIDRGGWFSADLAISLDVVYHLVEDRVFETYMKHLFGAAQRYVIVYSTNSLVRGTAPHVRHREFTSWIDAERPEWRLISVTEGPNIEPTRADFFVYERDADGTEALVVKNRSSVLCDMSRDGAALVAERGGNEL